MTGLKTGTACGIGALMLALTVTQAAAVPARIILLRHGEKHDAYRLCAIGEERAAALAAQYLGRDAATSLFRPGEVPKAFFAITPHTLETIAPSARSWGQPVILYPALPGGGKAVKQALLDAQTRQMAENLLTDPRWNGATVVVTWEHGRIASTVDHGGHHDAVHAKRKAGHEDGTGVPRDGEVAGKVAPEQPTTLYDLFGLARFAEALGKWPFATYDYFWIIDFDSNTRQATSFRQVKQVYTGSYANLPQNDWGQPNGLTKASGCAL